MKVYGLAGGSGSGKGTAARLFSEYSIRSIDTDAVYHDITSWRSECLIELAHEFGDEIISPDGALDRKRLAQLVFGDRSSDKHKRLNEITHKHVLSEVRRIISEMPTDIPAVLIDAPMLFESGFDRECDGVICVVAPQSIRIARITARDGIDEESARRRIAKQLPDEYLIGHSDYTIVNDGSIEHLSEQVKHVAGQILM